MVSISIIKCDINKERIQEKMCSKAFLHPTYNGTSSKDTYIKG